MKTETEHLLHCFANFPSKLIFHKIIDFTFSTKLGSLLIFCDISSKTGLLCKLGIGNSCILVDGTRSTYAPKN